MSRPLHRRSIRLVLQRDSTPSSCRAFRATRRAHISLRRDLSKEAVAHGKEKRRTHSISNLPPQKGKRGSENAHGSTLRMSLGCLLSARLGMRGAKCGACSPPSRPTILLDYDIAYDMIVECSDR